jgi:NADH:ubiquinone oxidoreductase subunit H
MSLKAFHLFFVAVSILFTLAFGAWGIVDFRASRDTMNLAMGILSLLISSSLVVYGGYVIRKLKGVSMI